MTRTEIKLRTFWYVSLKIWWFKFKHTKILISQPKCYILFFFVLIVGVAMGQWWRIAQVKPGDQIEMGYQEEIARLHSYKLCLEATVVSLNDKLRKALGDLEAGKAIAKNKRRGK